MHQANYYSDTVANTYSTEKVFDDKKFTRYFIFFLFCHTLFWTLGIYWSRASLPHDILENITWGLQGQWGYHKHPFLTAWLCSWIFSLFNQADWALYLFAQLVNTSTFIAVWLLAKELLPLRQALLATLLLEGILFYNVNSFNLTPDTLQAPLWAFLSFFFYKALSTKKTFYWLLSSFFAACGVCTKYQTIFIISSLLYLFIQYPPSRALINKTQAYSALGFFILLISPHCYWLYQHHFITLFYALNSAIEYTETPTVWGHLLYPLLTLVNNIVYILPMLLLILPFYKAIINKIAKPKEISRKYQQTPNNLSAFQWHFLLVIGFGPLFLTLVLGVINGNYFPPRWSTPYFFALGIILIAYLNPLINSELMKQFILRFILFSILLFSLRILSINLSHNNKADSFLPNQEMALTLNKLWREHYSEPLVYLAGSSYLVSLITPYLPDKATPYYNWQLKQNPWLTELNISIHGALFIWDIGANYAWDLDGRNTIKLPQWVLEHYPELIILPSKTYRRLSNNHPLIIGVALLPPRSI